MKTLVLLLLGLVALCALSVKGRHTTPSATMRPAGWFGSTTPTTTTKTPTTTTKTPTTTTKTPPTTTTKTPPTTTTKTPPTTTTKTPPTTTTKTPPTTTTKTPPTTTTKTPPTTTKTTPTTAKTTTPAPIPPTSSTPLTVGSYNVTSDKKVICLLAKMALQIRLATPQANGTFNVMPNETRASGVCSDTTAELDLTFREGSVNFTFSKNSSGKGYVTALAFTLLYPLAKGASKPYSQKNTSLELFVAQAAHCYACRSDSVYMGHGLHLDITDVQLQAFQVSNNKFGSSDHCSSDPNDYRVAIAVGVTLLVLVIIVVVVYLLGRRKRTDGYQSL
ncbi:cell wall protein DAN4 [Thalassophryne amazonica]|uniref:cell wall protein DAN4 n=1 Tax=Thalassophryne amazonica TaxID=390379 RepID=UPI001470EF44|nr:cell wall protein DAN4 [Thalassophryne amazonica]